jgi:Domain of unknown function (DUF4148)
MLRPTLLAALTASIAILGATTTLAQEATPDADAERFVSVRSRAEVVAETQDAMRRGLIPRNERDSQRIVDRGFLSIKSREQVQAEAAEALRLGLIGHGEAGPPQATPAQLEQIRLAGLRALQVEGQMARR